MQWSYWFGELIGRFEVDFAVVTPASPGEVRLDSLSETPGPPHQHEELQRKKDRRRSENGLPLHSLSSLLQELAPRSRHQCRIPIRCGSEPWNCGVRSQ